MEKRNEERARKRIIARFKNGDVQITGFALNLSCHGLTLVSSTVPKFKEIIISLELEDGLAEISGECLWARKTVFTGRSMNEIGVRIAQPPENYYRQFCAASNM